LNKPKFVIGIGSQRAGSTLLHRILDECTDIFMHPVKELHYFDTLYEIRHQDVLTTYSQRQFDREFDRLFKAKEHHYIKNKKYKCFLRTNNILASRKINDVDYLDLYRPCLMGNHVVGEITPEYMILPEEGVKHMAELLGKGTAIILITRDPVDRFISAFKLLKVYGNENVDMSNFEKEIIDVFDSMPSWVVQQKQLNDYQGAYDKYSKYFSNVLMISYHELVGDVEGTHTKLETCLSIKVDVYRYRKVLGKKVNQIGETGQLSESALKLLEENLGAR
jgi:hypothetical protein